MLCLGALPPLVAGVNQMNDLGPNDPARLLKGESRIVSFGCCEVWFLGQKVIVDSQILLPDLKLREFARPKVHFESNSYYVSEKSHSSTKPIIYRYVLMPWPANDLAITRQVHLDNEYFQALLAEKRRRGWESAVFKALVIFYPFLGFLWSRPKRFLNQIGFEAHAMSGISTYTGFLIGLVCAVFLVIYEFGSKTISLPLVLGMLLFMIDAIARFDRLLEQRDEVPPGFYEWLICPKEKFE